MANDTTNTGTQSESSDSDLVTVQRGTSSAAPDPALGEKGRGPAGTTPAATSDTDLIPVQRTKTGENAGEPTTTAGGLAASTARGLAPMAAGAAVGAGVGAAGGPIGALGGATMVVGAESIASIYNDIAPVLGLPQIATPKKMTDAVMDWFGIQRPQTGAERVTEAVASSMGGTAVGTRAAEAAIRRIAPSTTREVVRQLARRPGSQVGSAVSATAGQTAAELGASPPVSQLVGMTAAGAVPGARYGRQRFLPTGQLHARAQDAVNMGYVLPPMQMLDRPGVLVQGAQAWTGQPRTRWLAWRRNQAVTNRLVLDDLNEGVARNLRIPDGTPITDGLLQRIREDEATHYTAVANAPLTIYAQQPPTFTSRGGVRVMNPRVRDPEWDQDLDNLGSVGRAGRLKFPNLVGSPQVEALRNELRNHESFTPQEGMDLVQDLRFRSRAHWLHRDNPESLALAIAERQGAQAVEALMERELRRQINDRTMVNNWVAARQRIAKTYDVQDALHGSNVSAKDLSDAGNTNRAGARRRGLSGRLAEIADLGDHFPDALHLPRETEEWTHVDWTWFLGGMSALLTGTAFEHPWVMAGGASALTRPALRHGMLSRPFQRWLANAPTRAVGSPDPRGGPGLPYVAPTYGLVPDEAMGEKGRQ